MRKLIIIAAAMLVSVPAFADNRHRRPPVPQGYHNHHHNRWLPYAIGGLALGAAGAGAYYYNRYCWDEQIVNRYGEPVYDRFGAPIVRRFCQ
jgi:hypothetical protein